MFIVFRYNHNYDYYRDSEAELMKLFFNNTNSSHVIDEHANSCVLSSVINATSNDSNTSTIRNSVICNVRCNSINADGCILMNVVANHITAKPGSILYNITTTEDINLEPNEVHVGVYNDTNEQNIVKSNLSIDGGTYWDKLALDNSMTYGQIYHSNDVTDPAIVEQVIESMQHEVWNSINNQKEEREKNANQLKTTHHDRLYNLPCFISQRLLF